MSIEQAYHHLIMNDPSCHAISKSSCPMESPSVLQGMLCPSCNFPHPSHALSTFLFLVYSKAAHPWANAGILVGVHMR